MRFATAALIATAALVAAKEAPLNDNGHTVDDSYIVKFKDTVSPADVQQHMDNLKEWNDNWPLRGEAGNGGIRVDDNKDSGDSGSKGDNGDGKGDSDKNHGTENQDDNKGGDIEKDHSVSQDDPTQQQFDPWHASLEDWQRHYEQVISGISHTWFYQAINYFGYSGRFSKEVLDKIRNDDRVAYVDKDQIVGI